MGGMPLQNILRESGVQHISVNIPAVTHSRVIRAVSPAETEHFRAQERRDNLDLTLRVITHRPETERKNLSRAPRHHIREKVQRIVA